MADIDIVAHLYPDVRIAPSDPSAIAIDLSGNKERRVAPRREPPHLVAAQPLTSYSRQDREPTEDPKQNDSLDYTACLKIDLSQIPKTSLGLVAGWDPKADIILPRVLGVSFHHFSLTFNDSYCLVVRDLGSRAGTSVIYDCADGGPRSNFQWIIGGDENLQGHSPITIKVVPDLQFRIVVDAYDTSLEAFRNKVDIFRAGTAGLEDTFGDIDIRPSTQLPTGIHTPAGDDFFLQKKLGEGAFAVVYHAWNVRTGAVHALKKPLGEVRNRHVKAWKNEALLMGRVSHDHIVKLLGSETGPPPSLRFEYLPGGSLRQHLQNGQYFSEFECVQITRQTLSALVHLHELNPSITHRDLSDANILVKNRCADKIFVKLGDFGISKEGPRLNTIVGTPYFLPPEFFGQRVFNMSRTWTDYTTAVDIWALAVVIAKLLCGRPKRTDEHDEDGKLWCEDIRRRVERYFQRTGGALAELLLETMLCIEPEMRKEARECHRRSLLLPNGSLDTWKTKAQVPTSSKKRDDIQDYEDEDEEQDEGDDDLVETTIILEGGNRVVKAPLAKGTEGVTAESAAQSEGSSVLASPRDFYRSSAPSPPTINNQGTELGEIPERMSDPESESGSNAVIPQNTSSARPRRLPGENRYSSPTVPMKRKA